MKQAQLRDFARSEAHKGTSQSSLQPYTTGVTSKTISLTTQKQATSVYCVPASGRAMLSTLAISLPSQQTLAGEMLTNSTGTQMHNAPGALNYWIPSTRNFKYEYDTNAASATDLWNRSRSDISSYNASLMLRALYGQLPWTGGSSTSGHASVDHGWFSDASDGTQALDFWDPWDNSYHSASLVASWNFNSNAGRQEVW